MSRWKSPIIKVGVIAAVVALAFSLISLRWSSFDSRPAVLAMLMTMFLSSAAYHEVSLLSRRIDELQAKLKDAEARK